MRSSIALLHLALIPGIGTSTVEKIVKEGGLEVLDSLYALKANDFCTRFSLTLTQALRLQEGLADKSSLREELKRIEACSIEWTTLFNDDYPPLLKVTYLPPLVLYWQGKHPSSYTKTVAFVGARKADVYGERVARMLIPSVSKRDWCIVSGGARGADAYAHKAALQAGGSTIAVLGSGLLKLYPPEHKGLFKAIVQNGGTLLSSFPLTVGPQACNFPARNRIIAGLSKACVVLQACQKSGALITASYALQEGRDVCAVPGPIDNPLSEGCHRLLSQGAQCITSAQELFYVLGEQPSKMDEVIKGPDTLSDSIMAACRTPMSFDDLLLMTRVASSLLHEELFSLQIEGKLRQNFMGLWTTVF